MSTITPVHSAARALSAATGPSEATAGSDAVVLRGTATVFESTRETLGKNSMSVRERFATLQQRFLPSKVKGVDVRFQFNLSGDGGGQWYCEIKNGKLTVKEGTGPNPTATLSASASDYKKIADGEMNKMFAFVRGKLKVKGDKEALKLWDTYFKEA